MSNKETGGSAHPVVCDGDPCIILHSEGMTLRDYFAGQALIGLMTCEYTNGICAPTCSADPVTLARWSYLQADAMVKESSK